MPAHVTIHHNERRCLSERRPRGTNKHPNKQAHARPPRIIAMHVGELTLRSLPPRRPG